MLLTTSAQNDSTLYTLSAAELVSIVRSYHPLAQKASLAVERAIAGQLSARGVFDPVLGGEIGAKRFDATRYYSYEKADLAIPLWFGLTASAGIVRQDGERLPIEETVGRTGFAGLEWEVAQSILIDKRRAAIRMANLVKELSINDQQLALNDLLRESLHQYWDWVQAYQNWQTLEQAFQANDRRIQWIRQMIAVGEMAAIDSTEARAQWQYFRSQADQARLQWEQATLELSTFLWTSRQQTYLLPENVQPDASALAFTVREEPGLPTLDSLYLQLEQHPKLQQFRQQLKLLDIRRRLQFQDILPQVKLQYQRLGKGFEVWQHASSSVFDDNYRYGVKLNFPLRMSSARGAYRSTRISIQQTELDQLQTVADLRAGLGRFYAAALTWNRQLDLLDDNQQQYEQLLRSEEVRLRNGESSLFIVNNREIRALDARLSLIKAKITYQRSLVSLDWALANLN